MADTEPTDPAGASAAGPAQPRAGRNLPAAIGVGVLLGGAVVTTLFTARWAFVAVAGLAIMLAVFELTRALRVAGIAAPQFPLVVGAGAVLAATFAKGTEALVISTALLIAAAVVWVAVGDAGSADSAGHGGLVDVAGGVFAASYVVFLAGFAILLAVPADGPRRVLASVATVVCSDTGGYAVGVLVGRHPMAPTVSPKKSWEGFAGSTLASVVFAAVYLPLVLHGTWWQGVVFGLAIVVAATVGDLSESLLKRDLGIKDMGTLLPGHGGMLDRVDAQLFAAPVAWALLTVFIAWPAG